MLIELDVGFLCEFLRVLGIVEFVLIFEVVVARSNLNVYVMLVGGLSAGRARAGLREDLRACWELLTLLMRLIAERGLLRPLADLSIFDSVEIVYYLQVVAVPVLERVEGLGVAGVLRAILLEIVLYSRALCVLV